MTPWLIAPILDGWGRFRCTQKFVCRKSLAVLALLVSAHGLGIAQETANNEFAVSIGRTFISDQLVPSNPAFDDRVHFGKGLSFDFDYARFLKNLRWSTLSFEVPLIYNSDEDLNYGLNVVPDQYSSIFITPGLRLAFLRDMAFSPWVSFGGGIAHFVASRDLEFGGAQNRGHRIDTTGSLEGGVGFDVKVPKLTNVRFRFEARDDWTGVPPLNVNTGRSRQHNYYVGGGIVFRF